VGEKYGRDFEKPLVATVRDAAHPQSSAKRARRRG
jgi:hypothetical protein